MLCVAFSSLKKLGKVLRVWLKDHDHSSQQWTGFILLSQRTCSRIMSLKNSGGLRIWPSSTSRRWVTLWEPKVLSGETFSQGSVIPTLKRCVLWIGKLEKLNHVPVCSAMLREWLEHSGASWAWHGLVIFIHDGDLESQRLRSESWLLESFDVWSGPELRLWGS